MARFLLKHLLYLCITLVVVSFLVFMMTEFSPGDVARKILGAYATPETALHDGDEVAFLPPMSGG